MSKKFLYYFIFLFFFSCEDNVPIRDNPLDDESGDYVSPTINLVTSISDGDTLFVENLLLECEGNELVSEFRFRLDNLDWTEWNEDASVLLDYLDEGNHQIFAQSRYLNGDTSDIVNINFFVDAVSGPALMFYPRRHFTEQNQSVTFSILAEEVTNLMASEVHLEYDPSKIQIMSVSQGDFFQNAQNSIFLYEINSESGDIQINTTLLDSDVPSIEGTGSIASLEVKLLQSGSSTISFNGSDVFIDPDNNNINILEKINGLVITK
jgi:hypothetical protein